MKFKRLIAFVSAMSIMASTMVGVSASNEGNEVLSAWGNSSITLGKDFGIVTKSDGNCYISNEDYNNVNFNRTFNTGKTVKVAVPNDLAIAKSYALILRENGEIVGFNLNQSDLSAHSTQINSVRVTEGAVDVLANDTKAVALMADGTVKFTQNTERGSKDIKYYVDVEADGSTTKETVTETVYAPNEEAEAWSDIKKIDLEDDYILGLTSGGQVRMSNSNKMKATLSTSTTSYEKPTVTWENTWGNSDFEDEMDSIKTEVELLSNIKDIDGTQNFVVYVNEDGTCGMVGGELYSLSDEIITWTDIKLIKAYAEPTKALVVGIKEDGSIVTTTYGASVLLEDNNYAQLEMIDKIEDAIDVEIHKVNSTYNIVVKHENLKYTNISVGNAIGWLDSITSENYDTILPVEYEIFFEDSIRKVAFKLNDKYQNEYKLYIKEKIDDEEIEINEVYEYVEPLVISDTTTYEYIITKNVNGTELPSSVYNKTIAIKDNEPIIVSSIEPGVVNKGDTVNLHVQFNGETLDGFDIKYIKVDLQNNDTINKMVKNTIDDLVNSNDIDVLALISEGSVTDYESGINIDKNCDLFVWSVDTNNGNNVNSTISHFRYNVLMSRPNVYPYEEYKAVYSDNEVQDISNGYRVTRRNTMMVKAGSYMSAALATNGEVWSSKISTVSNKDMSVPIKNVTSVPASANSTDWLATRMWRMISDIAVGESHVAGLRIDGTVVASGNNEKSQCNVSEWKDIVDIAAGKDHTVGLTKTGEVIGTTSSQGDTEDYGQTEFNTWMYKYNDSLTEEENKALEKEQRIVAIEANNNNTIGLRNNGTVVVAGNNDSGQCNTDTWTDIIDIAMGTRHAVGLKSDGTVVATGDNGYGQCNVGSWKNVVQISASAYETVGITYDGRVLSTNNAKGAISVYGAQDKLADIQPELRSMIGTYNANTGSFNITANKALNNITYETTTSSGETTYKKSSFSSEGDRILVYSKLDEMYNKGIKFKYISSGNYVTIAVDEEGIVYNIIHSEGPDSPNDAGYPVIKIDNENYAPVLDRGPTVVNNYYNGYYNKELNIKLSSTTGEENNILWSLDNTDVYAMGTNSTSLTFDNAQILNVAPYSLIGTHRVSYPEIKYMYKLGTPDIQFSVAGLVEKGTPVVITSTRPQKYKIYYTVDNTEPTFVKDGNGNYVANQSTIEYTGAVKITESMTIKAKAFDINYIDSNPKTNVSSTFEASYIVSDGELGNTGTIIEDTTISNNIVFTRQGSPYTIVNNLTVASGATLSIEPGVTIKVADNKGIVVNGNLISYGTQEEPVIFTSDTKWNGIQLNSQSGNNESVIKNIDVNNASTALSINTEATRIIDGIQYISLHNNDNGLSVQSDGIIVSHIMTYDNKNGYGIAVNADDVTVDNCHIAGNSIGINVNGFNCNITYCNITNNANYGIFLDGGADHYMSKIVVNYNTIDSNYSINKETGEKIGYNVGCTDATYLYSMEVNFLYNYWGNPLKAEILKTLPPSDKSPVFIFEDRRYDPVYHDSIDINTEYISDTEEVVSSITSASKAIVNVKRTGGAAYKLPLIIVGYNETGEMVTMQIIDGIIPADDSGTYEVDLNEATELKVLIWESLDSMKPLL